MTAPPHWRRATVGCSHQSAFRLHPLPCRVVLNSLTNGRWYYFKQQRETPPFVWSSPFALLLIQQQKLHLPSPLYRADFPPLVVAIGYILLIDVPVTGFQLFQQTAFRVFPISEQSSVTHIVAEYGQDQLSKPQHYPKNIVFYSVNHSVIGWIGLDNTFLYLC